MITSVRRAAVAASIAALLGITCSVAYAQARQRFELEPQPLAKALNAFAAQAGINVYFTPAEVEGRQSSALAVDATAEEALSQLLSGTGLSYRKSDDKTIIVSSAKATEQSATSAPAAQEIAAVEEIDTIVVTARRRITTGKTDTPIIEEPQNIQVLSGALLKDQGAVLLDDALRNVAGVMPGGYFNGYDYYRIRGFDSSTSTYLDGLLFFNGISQSTEIAGLERVEVAKGPPSSLYGQAALGGVVNLVSKRPTTSFQGNVEVTGGNEDFYDVQADVSGPLTDDGTLAARLVGVYRHTGSFVDYADGARRIYVAPSVQWRLSERTTLTLLFKYQDDHLEASFPIPAFGTVLDNPNGRLSERLYVANANDPAAVDQWRAHQGYELVHKFSDNVELRQNFRATQGKQEWRDIYYPALLFGDLRTLAVYPYELNNEEKNVAVDTAVKAVFSTGRISHALTFGIDHRRNSDLTERFRIDFNDLSSFTFLDLFAPDYSGFTKNFVSSASTKETIEATGVYLQDSISLTETFTLTVGGRKDYSKIETRGGPTQHDDAFTPRAGLTWEFRPQMYLYASYSESFLPLNGFNSATGELLKPEEGRQSEIGLKTALWDGRLTTTTAVYQLDRSNVAIEDPFAQGAYLGSGKQRSRGFEFDGQFQLTDGLELLAAYSYVDAENTQEQIIDGYQVPKGTRLQNIPEHSVSVWVRYRFTDGPLQGLALSAGGNYYSDQAADIPDTFSLPSYTIINANVAYKAGPYRIQLNVRNLFDEEYFIGSYNEIAVLPGHRRTYQITLGRSF